MRTQLPPVRNLVACGLAAAGLFAAGRAVSQTPPPKPAPAPEPTVVDPANKDYGTRVVAYIHGTTPVTRADLAEYLIARGGYEKVEVLVNKKIIDTEAARRGITVTPQEMEAALQDDLKGIQVSKADFISVVLPKYNKSFFEWMEDVVRPRLILTKMCRDKVKVTDEDLKKEYERQYGEKRDVRIIMWPSGDDKKAIFKLWDDIRKNDNEFNRVARNQANPGLAATGGQVKPITRHSFGADKIVETTAFALNEAEVSSVFETAQGPMVVKLIKIIPADAVPFEKVKEKLTADVFELKLTMEIPKQFEELKTAAKPQFLLTGPPTQWQFKAATKQMVDDMQKK